MDLVCAVSLFRLHFALAGSTVSVKHGFKVLCCAVAVTNPRQGTFKLGADSYNVELQDLPTVVECYKSYDDIHLVKCLDIGQVSTGSLHRSCRYTAPTSSGI